jgi:hypothetical protein
MAVSGYNTVTSFFDESGKFKDHRIIAFGGIASYNKNIDSFAFFAERAENTFGFGMRLTPLAGFWPRSRLQPEAGLLFNRCLIY